MGKIIYPFEEKTITYRSKNWFKKLIDCWLYTKLMNLDMQGWSYKRIQEVGERFGLKESARPFMLRGLVSKKPYHTKVEIFIKDDYSTLDIVKRLRDLSKAISNFMKEYDAIILGFGYETWDLDETEIQREIILTKKSLIKGGEKE